MEGQHHPAGEFAQWTALIDGFVRHCLQRYGEEEVRQWYFEVWNETESLPGFLGRHSQPVF